MLDSMDGVKLLSINASINQVSFVGFEFFFVCLFVEAFILYNRTYCKYTHTHSLFTFLYKC